MFDLTDTAIARLMQTHRRELLNYLTQKLNCNDAAQDIFQETFLRYAGYPEKHSINNPRAFIFRIAGNLATDYLRSRSRQMVQNHDDTAEDELTRIENPLLSVERIVMSEQQLELLAQALADLPPKCREVFILLKLKHCSYAQVETELGISQTMILKYLTRAINHCRQQLDL